MPARNGDFRRHHDDEATGRVHHDRAGVRVLRHRHPTGRDVRQCLADYRQREFSDRRAVAVAPWTPTEGRDLNDAELKALHADAG